MGTYTIEQYATRFNPDSGKHEIKPTTPGELSNVYSVFHRGEHVASFYTRTEAEEYIDLKSGQRSDGSSADYYTLPPGTSQLQDLISYRNMNAQDGEIFRAIYRKGLASHSDELRDAKKVLFYANAEVERLKKLEANRHDSRPDQPLRMTLDEDKVYVTKAGESL